MPIELRNVSYSYSAGTPFAKQVLRDVSLSVEDGAWVAVTGLTGSGKSTLLQHLNGLLKPDRGEVLIDRINIHSSAATLREARRKVGLVFQYPEHQLFAGTVRTEIAYGPENFGYPAPEVEGKVKKAMAAVGLDFNRYQDRPPHELSGGEKRRVALAGVLAAEPRVIALDEPTAGMDPTGKRMVIETITRLNRDQGISVIWVTHELNEIAALVDRLVVLDEGRVIDQGPVREVLTNPGPAWLSLALPVMTIADCLRKKGKQLTRQPLTMDEIKEEIIRHFK